MFGINTHTCDFDYQAIKNAADQDFHKFTKEIHQVCSNLRFDIMTEYGKNELEFILMYMHSVHGVQRVNLLGHIGNILLIYMKPSEVYQIFMKLVANTGKIKNNPAEKNRLRWHIPKDETDQG